jgi:methionyl-tRNA formyltransferase
MKFWNSRIPRAFDLTKAAVPGAVLGFGDEGAYIQCGEGVLEALEMQKPGGKKTSAKTCLQTLHSPDGQIFFCRKV